MKNPPPIRSQHVYVVQLHAPPAGDATALSGRLEHVLSGRRHDFDNGAALLACLAHEQHQVALAEPQRTGPLGG